jgi:DNA-binding response OmpR family regulator
MNTKVLIIEDDELLREIYATKLSLEGFKVDTADDGAQGLEKALRSKPDVILLDMLMPNMDGLEFLKAYRIQNTNPKCKTLVISNKSSVSEINQAKAMGVVEYLIKSQHTPAEIARRIRAHTGQD